jgi:A/G-specific adenine glycosylase
MSGTGRGFAAQVIAWQKKLGRHDLPWQNTRDAYRIWLSEIMLQQTQVATVIGYYERFLARYPDVAALARAPLDDVLAVWSGLGYYSRARNLHATAERIVTEHGGRFPEDFEAVLALPGIGRSTAAAICIFAYGARHAILDGNVKRLLARRFGIEGYPGDARVQAKLWRIAEDELPVRGIEAYTQGLMDLGATVCTRGKPRCDACPVSSSCVAKRRGTVAQIPAPRPRTALPLRHTRMAALVHAGSVLLEKRPAVGVWGGLWSLPEIADGNDAARWCAQRYGVKIAAHEQLMTLAHGFTHFKLEIAVERLNVGVQLPHAAAPGTIWLTVEDALEAAIPTPVRRILNELAAHPKRKGLK